MNIVDKTIDVNFTQGRPGWDGFFIIILHTMEGYLAGADSWFANPESQVSTHYGVGFNGEIHQYVSEDDTAWANGQNYANRNGISIEFEDQTNPMDSVRTNALYESGAQLIADICKRRNIACNTSGIKRHNEFVDKVCPGALDIDRLIKRANEILSPKPVSPTPSIPPVVKPTPVTYTQAYVDALNVKLISDTNQIGQDKLDIYNLNQQITTLINQNTNLQKLVNNSKDTIQYHLSRILSIILNKDVTKN